MHSLSRFYICIVLTLAVAVALPAWIFYEGSREEFLVTLSERQEQLALSVKRELLLRLDNALLITDLIAASPTLRSYYANGRRENDARALVASLTRASRKHAPESIFFILNADGSVALSEDNVPLEQSSFAVSPKVMADAQRGSSQIVTVHMGQEIVPLFVSPVVHGGEFMGTVAMVWPLKSIMGQWEDGTYVDSKQPMRVFLVSDDLKLLFHSEGEWKVGTDVRSSDLGQLIARKPAGIQYYNDISGLGHVGALCSIAELGGTVGVSTPTVYVDKAIQGLLLKGFCVALLFTSLAAVLVYVLLSRLGNRLRQRSRQMDMIMQGAGMGMWDCDITRGLFSYDDRWAEVVGLPELKGGVEPLKWLWGHVHPQDREVLLSLGGKAGEGECFSYEFRFRQEDGSWRWLQSWGRVVHMVAGGKARQLTGVTMDVDARKLFEQHEALQKHKLEALVAQRTVDLERARDEALAATEAKSFFLSTMSHEIRTPLNAVVGFIQLFERDNLRSRQIDYLDKIRTASQGLLSVINDVLDISKIEAGKLEVEHVPFSLRSVVEAVCSISGFAVKDKNLYLKVKVEEGVPDRVLGDPTRLHQILLNLLSNAIKFTRFGGITVRVRCAEQGSSDGNASLMRLHFSVGDTGLGMSPEQVQRLFKPFSQADSTVTRNFGGTGLGLAICKRLVELMGGVIGVTSTPGQGAEFTFTICVEISSAATELSTIKDNSQDVGALKGALLLVVEDNVINQEIARTQLENLGLVVDVAENGQEAVDMVQKKLYSLVFMDMQMPVMDGLTATKRIRALAFEGNAPLPQMAVLPIIAMTANAMNEDRQRCLDAGMNGHLAKPFDVAELQRILLHWIQKS